MVLTVFWAPQEVEALPPSPGTPSQAPPPMGAPVEAGGRVCVHRLKRQNFLPKSMGAWSWTTPVRVGASCGCRARIKAVREGFAPGVASYLRRGDGRRSRTVTLRVEALQQSSSCLGGSSSVTASCGGGCDMAAAAGRAYFAPWVVFRGKGMGWRSVQDSNGSGQPTERRPSSCPGRGGGCVCQLYAKATD